MKTKRVESLLQFFWRTTLTTSLQKLGPWAPPNSSLEGVFLKKDTFLTTAQPLWTPTPITSINLWSINKTPESSKSPLKIFWMRKMKGGWIIRILNKNKKVKLIWWPSKMALFKSKSTFKHLIGQIKILGDKGSWICFLSTLICCHRNRTTIKSFKTFKTKSKFISTQIFPKGATLRSVKNLTWFLLKQVRFWSNLIPNSTWWTSTTRG